ncbi:MAG: hypothetical protein CFH01_01833, partial [Alphaproteobacteria bacterium MarineAlpha2_Bin1]
IEKRNSPSMKYGRVGTTTTFAFEEAIKNLEEGSKTIIFPSGLSAISTAILSVVKKNSHILVSDSVYYPTRRFCDHFLKKMGIQVQYFDPIIGSEIKNLLKENTVAIFLESPGSLTFEIQDIPLISSVARENKVKVILDNTWATPLYFKPLKYGVDLSVHSATKYISGHSDAMLGVVTSNEQTSQKLEKTSFDLGIHTGPDDIYLGLRGLRTLEVRMKQHQRSGLLVAKWLENQPEVNRVLHPALPNNPGHKVWRRDFSGASGLFGFIIKSEKSFNIERMVNSLNLFSLGASWGGFESLCIPTWPYQYRTIKSNRNDGHFFRLSIGLEDPEDLIEDLKKGFKNL